MTENAKTVQYDIPATNFSCKTPLQAAVRDGPRAFARPPNEPCFLIWSWSPPIPALLLRMTDNWSHTTGATTALQTTAATADTTRRASLPGNDPGSAPGSGPPLPTESTGSYGLDSATVPRPRHSSPPDGHSPTLTAVEETVDVGPLSDFANINDNVMAKQKQNPSLRSSLGFSSPSYGAMSSSGTLPALPDLPGPAPETTEIRRPATSGGLPGGSTHHPTLRPQRSHAASLFTQYDAVTGGSARVPPSALTASTLLSGLGGSRFDVAGTAAPVSAVPSEASFDGSSLSDAKFSDDDDEEHSLLSAADGSGPVDEYDINEFGYAVPLGEGMDGTHEDEERADDRRSEEEAGLSGGPSTHTAPADNSPFAQVRASVMPVDNTLLSIQTPRMWVLSMLFSVLGSATNLFFSLRYPSVAITPVIALLLVHPLGLTWDWALKRPDDPAEEYVDGVLVPTVAHRRVGGRGLGRLRLWLAQGRWNEKEHTCVYVSSNVSFGFAFATDVIVEQTRFYQQDVSLPYQLLLTLSTQIIGYAFAGLTRRFLVRPSGMIWPSTLMSASMFATLHKEENRPADGWRISRWHFFYAVFLGAFLFYFVPGLLMPALSYFNVVTWFAPDNVVVANLFGVVSGLGLFPLTFDWAQIAYIGSPLLTPFWAAMNVVGGLVVVMWIIAPLAYYGNWLYAAYMPILSAAVFDNTGAVYDVRRILTPDFLLDRAAYRRYSRVFLPITYVLSYGVQFAGLASLLTHTVCWHGRDIWRQWQLSLEELREQAAPWASTAAYAPVAMDEQPPPDSRTAHAVPLQSATARHNSLSFDGDGLMSREDVHNRLMRRYRDAPMWWYLATFVAMTATGMFIVEYYPIHLPWYGLLLALGICAVLFIPIGIIMAVTNQHVSIYLICQLICGAVFPGRPIANMIFVTYGYISSAQGIKFSADLKLGHYMKIPPRILFQVQMAATLVSSVTQIGVLNWMFANIPGLCTSSALNGFTCPIARVHFNGSILWGVVGPGEFFGPGATYRPLVWCFLVGAIAPIPLWLYARRHRDSIVRKINLPVLLGSLGWIPPATGLNFSVWALVCYLFNYQVKNRATAWWAKYTMTLSAALDAALASGIVVAFFAFIYPGVMDNFHWWGTEVYRQGCDWRACSYLQVPEGGRFGPETW